MKLSISISQSNLLNVMWLLCNGYFRILLCCIIILHYAAYIAMTSHQYFCYTPVVVNLWHSNGQRISDASFDDCDAELNACIHAKSRHFEHVVN